MEERNIMKLLAKASKLNESKQGFLSREEWQKRKEINGGKLLKRNLLGFCGKKSIKSKDELANILYEIGVVESIDKGKEMVPRLYGQELNYDYDEGYIHFNKVYNARGEEAVEIQKARISSTDLTYDKIYS